MYKTICNYLLYKIFYLLRKQARLSARDFLIPTVGPKRRLPVRHTPGRLHTRPPRAACCDPYQKMSIVLV